MSAALQEAVGGRVCVFRTQLGPLSFLRHLEIREGDDKLEEKF
jgi:hypothetical protein